MYILKIILIIYAALSRKRIMNNNVSFYNVLTRSREAIII